MGLLKATARVDSRLKLTFAQLVSQLITCDKLTSRRCRVKVRDGEELTVF